MYNTCICRNLAHSKSWNICNPSIIAYQCIFRTLSYLWKFSNIQNSDIFKAQHIFRTLSKIYDRAFCKNSLKSIIILLHLRSLAAFWICLSLSKYSLTCWETLCYVLYDTYQNPVYYCKFRHIQVHSCPIQTYSAILWYIWNPV